MKKILALTLALCMVLAFAACGSKTEEPSAAEVAPAAEAPAAATAPAGNNANGPSGEPSGEREAKSFDCDIEVDGQTVTAHYADVEGSTRDNELFTITVNGVEIEGKIDRGVWSAISGDAADQAIIDQVQAAFVAGASSGEPAA